MRPAIQRLAACLTLALSAVSLRALAQPLTDPWVPPEVRSAASAPETRGAALQAQVERKLRESFEAADAEHRGTLTREQARAAGLGFVANHFEGIDTRRAGRVSFEDVRRYWAARSAAAKSDHAQ